jgi:hypothetical protein
LLTPFFARFNAGANGSHGSGNLLSTIVSRTGAPNAACPAAIIAAAIEITPLIIVSCPFFVLLLLCPYFCPPHIARR